MVIRRHPTSPKVVNTIRWRSARFTCSYMEEDRALEETGNWLQTGVAQNNLVAVFTDSKSLHAALLEKSTGLDPPRFKIKRQNVMLWISGHSDILGNEMTDCR